MELVVATRNAGKLHEFRELVRGLGVSLRSLDEFPELTDPEETGATFAENAQLKARAAAEATGLWALGDDSGLCVDALDGAPGIRSARFALGSDAERWRKLLTVLEQVPADGRTARFVCALAIASPGGQVMVEEGRCEGRIADAPRGAHGFGYDPIFELAGEPSGRTLAELSTAEKRAVSHRGRAFDALRPQLIRLLRGR